MKKSVNGVKWRKWASRAPIGSLSSNLALYGFGGVSLPKEMAHRCKHKGLRSNIRRWGHGALSAPLVGNPQIFHLPHPTHNHAKITKPHNITNPTQFYLRIHKSVLSSLYQQWIKKTAKSKDNYAVIAFIHRSKARQKRICQSFQDSGAANFIICM